MEKVIKMNKRFNANWENGKEYANREFSKYLIKYLEKIFIKLVMDNSKKRILKSFI